MPTRERFLLYSVLFWLIAGLGLVNWELAGMKIDVSPIAAGGLPAPSPADQPHDIAGTIGPGPLASLGETVSRPLFNPTRRPIVVTVAAPPAEAAAPLPELPPPAPVNRLSLIGLMRAGGHLDRALIRTDGQPHGTWVEVGSEIDGWRLAKIEDNRVLIENAGAKQELLLHATAPREKR